MASLNTVPVTSGVGAAMRFADDGRLTLRQEPARSWSAWSGRLSWPSSALGGGPPHHCGRAVYREFGQRLRKLLRVGMGRPAASGYCATGKWRRWVRRWTRSRGADWLPRRAAIGAMTARPGVAGKSGVGFRRTAGRLRRSLSFLSLSFSLSLALSLFLSLSAASVDHDGQMPDISPTGKELRSGETLRRRVRCSWCARHSGTGLRPDRL